MCNLYSITTNQAAIIALFRVVNRYVGNLAPMPACLGNKRSSDRTIKLPLLEYPDFAVPSQRSKPVGVKASFPGFIEPRQ